MRKKGIVFRTAILAITVSVCFNLLIPPALALDYISKSLLHPPDGETYILIDTEAAQLGLYVKGKKYKSYPVALGKDETPTPVGTWKIKRQARNWGEGFGSRWMALSVPWGLYGIHGTNKPWSVGTYASGGCIRMLNEDVEEVYDKVKVGTVVIISGEVFSPFYEERRRLHAGHRGTDVMLLQGKLKEQGYFKGEIDGFFCEGTEEALKQFQKDHFFEVTGQLNRDNYAAVGL